MGLLDRGWGGGMGLLDRGWGGGMGLLDRRWAHNYRSSLQGIPDMTLYPTTAVNSTSSLEKDQTLSTSSISEDALHSDSNIPVYNSTNESDGNVVREHVSSGEAGEAVEGTCDMYYLPNLVFSVYVLYIKCWVFMIEASTVNSLYSTLFRTLEMLSLSYSGYTLRSPKY